MAVKADITIDIDKQVGNLQNLTNIYNARVGDNKTPLTVLWRKNGMALNLKGLHAFIAGKVGDGSYNAETDKVDFPVGTPVVKYEDDGSGTLDNGQSGLTTLLIPKQMWAKTGLFAGYIGLKDENGSVFTSKDIFFKVLGNVLDAGVAVNYFIDDFDNALAETKKKSNQLITDVRNAYLNETKNAHDSLEALKSQIQANRDEQENLNQHLISTDQKIDAGDVVTNKHFTDVTDKLGTDIETKLSQISTTVPWLKDSDTIMKTYPNGYAGVVIAADTMHKWLYYDGQWNDAGLYSETIAKDGDIVAYLDKGKTITWNPYSNDCELDLSNMTTGITIRGAKNISFTKEDVYKAFSSSPYTKLNGNIVTGKSFALVYYFSTNKLGVISPKDELATADSKILFLHNYTSINDGLLVSPQNANQLKELQFKAANAPFAYVAEGKDLSYDYSSNDCNLKFNGDWVEVYYNKVKYDVKVSDILEAARKSKVVTVTDDNVIKGQQFILYFDSKDGSVHFTDRKGGVPIDGYTLLEHEYSSYTGGPLVDYHVNFQALKLLEFMQKYKNTMQKYKNTIQNYKDTKEVPDYFKENLAEGIDRVNQNMGEAGPNSLSFLFITDMHWENNAKHSPLLVHEVMKRTGLPLMINGGDLINQGEKTAMRESLTEALDTVQYPGTFMATVRGNHDNNWNGWGGQHNHPDWKFSYNDIYGYEFAYMMRNKNLVDDFHYLNLGNDFTYTFTISDASNKKWRFICVDTRDFDSGTNINVDSSKKICDLLTASKGENIIFVAHIYNDNHKHTDFEQDLEKIVDARNAQGITTVSWGSVDFSASDPTSKVIACFGGHEHEDYDWTTPKGVPFILTDSDNAPRTETTKYGHEYGTVGEQCFDIMTINLSTKTIKAVRIGRGIDRQFNF